MEADTVRRTFSSLLYLPAMTSFRPRLRSAAYQKPSMYLAYALVESKYDAEVAKDLIALIVPIARFPNISRSPHLVYRGLGDV